MTIYLHIGMPKTGSTTIQSFLTRNRETLASLNYLYPAFDTNSDNHHDIFFTLKNKDIERIRLYKNAIANYLDESENLIISTENFLWNYKIVSPYRVKELFSDSYDIKIIIYIRNIYDYINSWYCEYIQGFENQGSKTFCDFATIDNLNNCNYHNIIEYWSDCFSRENIVIRSFVQNKLIDQNLLKDFLTTIGIDKRNIDDFEYIEHKNVSYNYHTLILMRYFNSFSRWKAREDHNLFKNALSNLSSDPVISKSNKNFLSLDSIDINSLIYFEKELSNRFEKEIIDDIFHFDAGKYWKHFDDSVVYENEFLNSLLFILKDIKET